MIRKIFIIILMIAIPALSSLAEEERRDVLRLSIDDVSALALYNNLDIQIVKLDVLARRTEILDAESIFDTLLSGEISYADDQLKPASTIPGTKSLTAGYEIGLSKLMPSGTTLTLEAADERNWSNSPFVNINPYHDASLKFSLKQSLGKNFFGLIDRGNVRITKLEIRAFDYTSLDKIEQYLAEAQKAYWKLVFKEQELKVKKAMYKKAKELFSIYKNKFSIGLVEDPELYAVQALLLKREADLLACYDLLNLANDELLLKINAADESFQMPIEVAEELKFVPQKQDFIQVLKIAILNRRDYKEAKLILESKDIDIQLKKNSLWPEIDLDASFERNGLDSSFSTAFKNILEEDNPKVYLGISFSLSLENRLSKGKLRRAEIEKAKQILKLKKIEKMILSSIHEKVKRVNLAIGKVITNKRIVSLETSKLAAENLHFSFGRSDSDTIIDYQNDLLSVRLALAQSIFDYKKTLIDLEQASNTLLDKYWKGGL